VGNVRTCHDSGALKAKRKGGQANSSTSAISSPPTSPVLTTPPGSNGSIVVSASAREQCLMPRGRDEKLAGPEHDITVSDLGGEPSVGDQEELAGIGVPVPGELAFDLTIRTS
jgi:hypothetical protein